jgi:integrase
VKDALQAINDTENFMKSKQDADQHIKNVKRSMTKLASETDIFSPTTVLTYIKDLKRDEKSAKRQGISPEEPLTKIYKLKLIYNYAVFCQANEIPFKAPKLNYESPIPIIPSTEEVNQIIGCASDNYATVFTIMKETAVESDELHKTPTKQIDREKGILSIVGNKQHANGTYNLDPQTATMLRICLDKPERETNIKRQRPKNEYPFPTRKSIGNAWREARIKASRKYQNKNLLNIPLKNLRNYAGAVYYFTYGKDAIATQQFMRHKNLQQTSNYLRGLKGFTMRLQKIGKIATTAEEAMELILQGFKEESVFAQGTPNEKHILTKINI